MLVEQELACREAVEGKGSEEGGGGTPEQDTHGRMKLILPANKGLDVPDLRWVI